MYMQRTINAWSCLPTAAAMVLDVPVSDILEFLGHDGSGILFPGEPEPYCRRSFHIQEIVDFAIQQKNTLLTPIEFAPQVQIAKPEENTVLIKPIIFHNADFVKRGNYYFNTYDGILLGLSARGVPHAVAWSSLSKTIYDPLGKLYGLFSNEFKIREMWIKQNQISS